MVRVETVPRDGHLFGSSSCVRASYSGALLWLLFFDAFFGGSIIFSSDAHGLLHGGLLSPLSLQYKSWYKVQIRISS